MNSMGKFFLFHRPSVDCLNRCSRVHRERVWMPLWLFSHFIIKTIFLRNYVRFVYTRTWILNWNSFRPHAMAVNILMKVTVESFKPLSLEELHYWVSYKILIETLISKPLLTRFEGFFEIFFISPSIVAASFE